jgi:hypothetical protein
VIAMSEEVRVNYLPRNKRVPFSRTFYRRSRWATHALWVGVGVSCLLYDWDTYLGSDAHLFHGIRPAVKRALDWAWGAPPAGEPQQQQVEKPSAHRQ